MDLLRAGNKKIKIGILTMLFIVMVVAGGCGRASQKAETAPAAASVEIQKEGAKVEKDKCVFIP